MEEKIKFKDMTKEQQNAYHKERREIRLGRKEDPKTADAEPVLFKPVNFHSGTEPIREWKPLINVHKHYISPEGIVYAIRAERAEVCPYFAENMAAVTIAYSHKSTRLNRQVLYDVRPSYEYHFGTQLPTDAFVRSAAMYANKSVVPINIEEAIHISEPQSDGMMNYMWRVNNVLMEVMREHGLDPGKYLSMRMPITEHANKKSRTADRNQEICMLFDQGVPEEEIMHMYGLSRASLLHIKPKKLRTKNVKAE